MSGITIIPVQSRREIRQFIDVPYRLYAGDPNWVPILEMEQKSWFKPSHEFYSHGAAQGFIAVKDGQLVGRIMAIHEKIRAQNHGGKLGGVGFFESTNDPDVANALFDAGENWLRSRGLSRTRGPISLTENDQYWGLLVHNFSQPYLGMNYNPPYYEKLWLERGYECTKNMLSFELPLNGTIPDRLIPVAERLKKNGHVTVRTLDMKHIRRDAELIRQIINRGFVGVDDHIDVPPEMIDSMVKQLKPIVDPDFVILGFYNGEPASFVLSLPDWHLAFKHVNGKSDPLSLVKLLLYKKKINRLRVSIFGTVPEYRNKGLEAAIFAHGYKLARQKGIVAAEAAWTAEDNHLMKAGIEAAGGKHYKTHRWYERDI
ncbi:MAG: hypothetical protein K9N11_09830 [Lentisphaeria bacterium]|nr:hypothetical protein [Candidatus Neomarinimicrobiota bacterium]MCF7843132.1 hypothetical protein [Lentisphaeria bacterium]